MKLISWNVAGFRACLKKGFEDFFYSEDADIYCLQEVKAEREQIPFDPHGYTLYLNPAEKKGYSGTAVYTRVEPIQITYGLGIEEHDHEGRVITAEFKDFFLVNQYVPNVKRDLSRLVRLVETQRESVITIARNGPPVARIIPADVPYCVPVSLRYPQHPAVAYHIHRPLQHSGALSAP